MSTVSFIIPAYNQCLYLSRAIDSVLEQSHPHVEVVVVDDGSTDSTPAVLEQYRQRPGIRLIHQANAGLAAARNRGLALATSDFVCFLDADDRLSTHYASRLAASLVDDPDVGFAYCNVQWIDVSDQPVGSYSVTAARKVLSGDIFDSLIAGGYFPPHCVLIRRGLLVALGGFDQALGGNADYELWLRVAAEGHRAAYVDEKLAFYRITEGSMSQDLEHMRRTRVLALERIAGRYPARLGAALSTLQELTIDLHTANEWLNGQWTDQMRRIDAIRPAQSWTFLEHLGDARLRTGTPDKLAVWDAIIEDQHARAIFLHPPALVEAVVPTGAAGRLKGAVAIHPDAWSKTDAAPCQFVVRVDGRVTTTAVLNPRMRAADRRWVTFSLEVPEAATPTHTVELETRAVTNEWFCWGLFKDVAFEWDEG